MSNTQLGAPSWAHSPGRTAHTARRACLHPGAQGSTFRRPSWKPTRATQEPDQHSTQRRPRSAELANTFIHSLAHSFGRGLLSTCYVSDTVCTDKLSALLAHLLVTHPTRRAHRWHATHRHRRSLACSPREALCSPHSVHSPEIQRNRRNALPTEAGQ